MTDGSGGNSKSPRNGTGVSGQQQNRVGEDGQNPTAEKAVLVSDWETDSSDEAEESLDEGETYPTTPWPECFGAFFRSGGVLQTLDHDGSMFRRGADVGEKHMLRTEGDGEESLWEVPELSEIIGSFLEEKIEKNKSFNILSHDAQLLIGVEKSQPSEVCLVDVDGQRDEIEESANLIYSGCGKGNRFIMSLNQGGILTLLKSDVYLSFPDQPEDAAQDLMAMDLCGDLEATHIMFFQGNRKDGNTVASTVLKALEAIHNQQGTQKRKYLIQTFTHSEDLSSIFWKKAVVASTVSSPDSQSNQQSQPQTNSENVVSSSPKQPEKQGESKQSDNQNQDQISNKAINHEILDDKTSLRQNFHKFQDVQVYRRTDTMQFRSLKEKTVASEATLSQAIQIAIPPHPPPTEMQVVNQDKSTSQVLEHPKV